MASIKEFTVWYLKDYSSIVAGTSKSVNTVEMKRCLSLFDLTLMGIAAIVGAGIFVVTGIQARNVAGPAVMLSYVIAGFVALVASLCYAEFASEVTFTGGAFVYASKVYGKAVGWFVAANLLLEYILAAASVAKGFTNYFAALIDVDLDTLTFCVANCDSKTGYVQLDPIALALVVAITIALCFGVKESFYLNAATVLISLATIAICVIAGSTKVDVANYTPFVPFGVKGVFSAASSVFFAYIGFDMVANAAEEARNPKRDVPLATLLSVTICTGCYVAMATVVAGMVPYNLLDTKAPFSAAFRAVGYKWGNYVVAVGALCGVFNTVFVVLFSLSRLLVILGRAELLPAPLTRVNPKTETPIFATATTCLIAGLLAFFVPLEVLADLVSLGTLSAFAVVCMGVTFRSRYQPNGPTALWKVLVPMMLVLFGGLACGAAYYYDDGTGHHWPYYVAFGGLWLLGTGSFYFLPRLYSPSTYKAPLNPLLPCLGAGAETFLIATLGPKTWKPWGYAMAGALGIYIINGVYVYMTQWKNGTLDVEDPASKVPIPNGGKPSEEAIRN